MLEKACCYVFERQLPCNFFIEYIVEFCLSHSLLSELKQTLKKIGTETYSIYLSDFVNWFVCVCFSVLFKVTVLTFFYLRSNFGEFS